LKRLSRRSIVLDVGSNLGYYAVHMAMLVGEDGLLIALEPQPHVFKALLAGVRLNGLGNILPLRLAISRRRGNVRMLISRFSNWSRV
jgi:FkbM family methyltransferase